MYQLFIIRSTSQHKLDTNFKFFYSKDWFSVHCHGSLDTSLFGWAECIRYLSQIRKGLCRQASTPSTNACGKVFWCVGLLVLFRCKVFQRICGAGSIEKRDVCRHFLLNGAFASDMKIRKDFRFDPSIDGLLQFSRQCHLVNSAYMVRSQ